MIEKVVSLRIKGGIFEKETNLTFFEKKASKNPKVSLVYGKNGSGKSTISRGFRNITGVEEPQIELSEMLDENDQVLMVTNEEQKSLYVFNEDFIEDNIKIADDGLNTIVVMGAVKDVDDKITKIRPEYEKSIEDQNEQQERCKTYEDANNSLCPEYYLNQMEESLRGKKGEDCWASRDRDISGKAIKSRVNGETYCDFIKRNPSKTRDELIVAYRACKEELDVAKSGSKRIDIKVPVLKTFMYKESDIINLLEEKIEKPVLSEREKMLFRILEESSGNQRLLKIKTYFSKTQTTKCPFCFQNVEAKYADELVQSIEKILSKKAEEHQEKLKKNQLDIFKLDLSPFRELPSEKIKDCQEKLEILNSTIERVNELIAQKIENVYEPVLGVRFDLKKKYNACENALLELENTRKEFNSKVTDTRPIIKKLRDINDDIAYYDVKDLHEKYEQNLIDKKSEDDKLEKLKKTAKALQRELEELDQEKKNARIAMDAINEDLAYIFFSKKRLRIEYRSDKYVLYSHEKPVKPGNVSVGERNALGLCYFFNHIMENKEKEDVYKTKYLIVIDDPVSSFDMENRIGILSYLKYKIGQYVRGNDSSKFLVLTHDMQTFYDIRSFLLEILSLKYACSEGKAYKYINDLEIANKSVHLIDVRKRNEYTELFGKIFDYAADADKKNADEKNVDEKNSVSIGNVMRKVMEAFGTFVYKKGMAQLSADESILSNFPEKERLYYQNFMYRLVLNSGSHMEERVKTIDDMNFFDYISEKEKQRTARGLICFLYKLNPLHVKAHLINKGDIEEKIKEWSELH